MRRLFNDKKGLSSSLFIISIIVFVLSITALISLYLWSQYIGFINGVDSNVIPQNVKDDIASATSKIMLFDRFFIAAYFVLLIGFIVSASTLPSSDVLSVIVYIVFLIATTGFSMLLTNSVDFLLDNTVLDSVSTDLEVTLYIIKYLPYSTFFTGLLGGIIFYSRIKNSSGGVGGGASLDGFE